MRYRLLGAALAVALAAGTAGVATTAPAQAVTQPVLFGQIDHWKTDIEHDDSQLRIHSGVVGLFHRWDVTTSLTTVVNWAAWVRSRGGVPMLDLVPPPSATLSQVAAGKQDWYLKKWAKAFAGYHHPLMLRLFPEMNGSWESYAVGTKGNSAKAFRLAFRHVVSVFRNAGARYVKYLWNPDRVYSSSYPLKYLWPGASYVDWIAFDAYMWGDSSHPKLTPTQLMYQSVKQARAISSTKPLMLAELGCGPYSGKPTWVANALPAMRKLGLKIVVWFDENASSSGGRNWRLDSSPSPSVLNAARKAVAASGVTWAGRSSLSAVEKLVMTGSW